MGAATQTPQKLDPYSNGVVEHCVMEGVRWNTYENLLTDLNDRPIFLTYDKGTLEITGSTCWNQNTKSLIDRLLLHYSMETNVPMIGFGMVTIKRKDLAKAIEPDSCYYVKSEQKMRQRIDLDFAIDPPPDLVIEMKNVWRRCDRIGVYAALGVPEIWFVEDTTLCVLLLEASAYRESETSLNFPELDIKKFESFLRMRPAKSQHEVVSEFVKWMQRIKQDDTGKQK